MDGATLVYSSNGLIDAGTAEINIGKYSSAIYVLNANASPVLITLNSVFQVYIPGTPASGWAAEYYCIPTNGYTKFKSNNTSATLSVYAIS
jgi:hypothetical protein